MGVVEHMVKLGIQFQSASAVMKGQCWLFVFVATLVLVVAVSCETPSRSTSRHLAETPVLRVRMGQDGHRYPLREDAPAIDFEVARASFDRLLRYETATSSRCKTLSVRLTDGEAFWGLGERFDAWNQRARPVECWTRDMAQGGPQSSYFAVPFVVSSVGYGIFVNCSGRVRFDWSAHGTQELRIEVHDDGMEAFVFRGTPREIVQAYTRLVGRPPLPPAWVFQPWISRNSYQSAQEIDDVIGEMERRGLRAGVVVLECWAQSLQNFRFEEKRFPNPRAWIESTHRRGYRVVLWETPSVWDSASTYAEAKTNGFLVLNADGSELVLDWLENARKIDFRKPAAREWWQKLHEPLIDLGVDGFKTDGGERMPDEFFHNLHPYQYQRSVLAAFAAKGKPGVTFSRSASAPCAGHSLVWAGDQHAEWASLRRVVRAGLSAALSGFPFWGHDIGGYAGTPSKKLYIRWLQLGAFSPIMQWHGMTPREPWHFGEDAVRIAKTYLDLRWELQPYLLAAAKQASNEGIPMWRPLALEFPDDPVARGVDDEFFLGDDLLVAPLLDERDVRTIYLPRGEWVDAWRQQRHTGPKTIEYSAALEVIPVFVRSGSKVAARFPAASLRSTR